VAKSEVAYLSLVQQFKAHTVTKEYLALVYGCVAAARGEIATLLDRHPKDRKKMAVVERKGREAVSRWQVEKRWDQLTLLLVQIETGRTHQIRVHLSHLHHPVVGDSVYGGGKRRAKALRTAALQHLLACVERQMLHAWRLALDHPITRQRLHFEAPVPEDFAGLLKQIDLVAAGEAGSGPRDERNSLNWDVRAADSRQALSTELRETVRPAIAEGGVSWRRSPSAAGRAELSGVA
jgi:23S rRNA pseudouridine1911/1915/1917 synthase